MSDNDLQIVAGVALTIMASLGWVLAWWYRWLWYRIVKRLRDEVPVHDWQQAAGSPQEGDEARFFRLVRLHSHEVPANRLQEHRVPAGTRLVGRLYIAPDGELVVTDGYPADEDAVPEDHPDVHNCDEMGCSSVSHVVARVRPQEGDREPSNG